MVRAPLKLALVGTLCLVVVSAQAQQRGKPGAEPKGVERAKGAEKPKGGEKPAGESHEGKKAPGGAWSEGKNKSQASGAESAAAERAVGNKNQPQATGKEGAAAGAAAAKRNQPAASGAEGAAAGAAAAKRNQPAATGAEGAAAGAAAAKRNQPAASGAEGAAVGAAAARRNQPAASGAAGAAAGYSAVRNSFDHPHLYNEQWYANHHGAWTAAKWTAGTAWALTGTAAVISHCGYENITPISYGYGNNVTYQNGDVILDGQNIGSAEAFSQQAADLALLGQEAKVSEGDDWLPLGVFALVRNEDQHPQLTVQLAINQQGILRGNYTDLVSDHALPIEGSVDQKTMRAAWTVGENKNFFMEAGLKNLTDGEAPALTHKYSKTELWMLIRLPQSE